MERHVPIGIGSFRCVSKTRHLLDSGLVELDTVRPRARSSMRRVWVRMQETIGKILNSTTGEGGIDNISCRVLLTSVEGLVFMLTISIILQCRRAILVAGNVP